MQSWLDAKRPTPHHAAPPRPACMQAMCMQAMHAGHVEAMCACRSQLPALWTRVVHAVCKVEKYLSINECDVKLHNLIHLVDTIEAFGEEAGMHACMHAVAAVWSQTSI